LTEVGEELSMKRCPRQVTRWYLTGEVELVEIAAESIAVQSVVEVFEDMLL
jgi:hypothetical protein